MKSKHIQIISPKIRETCAFSFSGVPPSAKQSWSFREFSSNEYAGEKKIEKLFVKFCENSKIGFRAVQRVLNLQSCRSQKMLKNEYLDAKIGVDTEENEPSKIL